MITALMAVITALTSACPPRAANRHLSAFSPRPGPRDARERKRAEDREGEGGGVGQRARQREKSEAEGERETSGRERKNNRENGAYYAPSPHGRRLSTQAPNRGGRAAGAAPCDNPRQPGSGPRRRPTRTRRRRGIRQRVRGAGPDRGGRGARSPPGPAGRRWRPSHGWRSAEPRPEVLPADSDTAGRRAAGHHRPGHEAGQGARPSPPARPAPWPASAAHRPPRVRGAACRPGPRAVT